VTALTVASARAVRRYAWACLTEHPVRLAVALLTYGLSVAAGLIGPRLVGTVVEQVQRGHDRLSVMTLAILAALAAQVLLLGLAVALTGSLAERIVARVRESFIDDVLSLSLARVERMETGDLVTRSTRDVAALVQVAGSAVPSAIVTLLTIVVTLAALLLLNWIFLAACLVAVPTLVPIARWYLKRSRPGYLEEQASYSRVTQVLSETVAGARTVEAYGLSATRRERMRESVEGSYRAEWYTLWLRTVFLPVTDFSIALPTVAVLLFGGLAYRQGWTSIAAVTAAALYTQQLSSQIDVLLYQTDRIQVGSAAMARLLGLAEGGSRAELTAGAARLSPPYDVSVAGVSFSYAPETDVLHAIDLDIADGERIAVVGPSGAGKTTLARLLVGIDDPHGGTVSLGGVALHDLPREQLRRTMSLVTQESFVFAGSIAGNLRIADPAAGPERLEQVLDAVGALPWARRLGLDAPLGGTELTPAQAQQLSLARLVLIDPRVVVLDEATSLLDPQLARSLERSLSALLEGRTVVTIAHRLDSAARADRIVVLDRGRIVESGPHRELLTAGGLYADLWQAWHGAGSELGGS
jgi:ABC-type multidrug transport system fused ATPase/permease subunit